MVYYIMASKTRSVLTYLNLIYSSFRTNKLFNGKIYAKDNPNSCVVDVEDKIEFSIKMGYSDIECNVKRKSQGFYSNEVIIQVRQIDKDGQRETKIDKDRQR